MKSKAALLLADAIDAGARQAPPIADPLSVPAPIRRMLTARGALSLVEIEEGLVEAEQGEPAFAVWLARPLAREEAMDPVKAAELAITAAAAAVERLPAGSPRTATIITALATVARVYENITKGRPREVPPDEVAARIAARRDEAVAKIEEHTGEEHAHLKKERAALLEWAAQNLGPMIAAELTRRVDAMLCEGQE